MSLALCFSYRSQRTSADLLSEDVQNRAEGTTDKELLPAECGPVSSGCRHVSVTSVS